MMVSCKFVLASTAIMGSSLHCPRVARIALTLLFRSITLLFQDKRGGLQVKTPKGTFVNATPIENTIVVNAGDLLAQWSNDTIKSTKHRVVEPPPQKEDDGTDSYPPRYSIAYFCNPNYERMIKAIPGTYEEAGRKYQDVQSGEYITGRLTATY